MEEWACFVRSLTQKYEFHQVSPDPEQQRQQDLRMMLPWATPQDCSIKQSHIDRIKEEEEGKCTAAAETILNCKDPNNLASRNSTSNTSGGSYDCQESTAASPGGTSCNDKILPSPPLVSCCCCCTTAKPDSPTSVLVLEHDQCCSSSSNASHETSKTLLAVNNLLADSGFTPLKPPLSEQHFLDSLADLARDYARRESFIQELLEQLDQCRKTEERNDVQLRRLEAQVQVCKRRLAASEQRSQAAASAADRATSNLRKQIQSLEATNSNLLQRCSQLQHNCRCKERDAHNYQNKLLEAIQKEETQRLKDLECYKNLKNKIMRSRHARGENLERDLLFRDLKPLQLVNMYEKQKLTMASEIDALRSQVVTLCQELQQKENHHFPHIRDDSRHFLEQLCKKLRLKSSIQLLDSVEDLLAINAAVPFLEEFVEKVCEVVFVGGQEFLPRSKSENPNPREVPGILKIWLEKLSANGTRCA